MEPSGGCKGRKPKPTFVYLIRAGRSRFDPVKIGVAIDPRARLAVLQTGNPANLQLLHWFKGGVREERLLHELLMPYRQSGEWFASEDGALSSFLKDAFTSETARQDLFEIASIGAPGIYALTALLGRGSSHADFIENVLLDSDFRRNLAVFVARCRSSKAGPVPDDIADLSAAVAFAREGGRA